MARPQNSEIERTLTRIVRRAITKGQEVTVKQVREQAEAALDLPDDFFKNDREWKERSRGVVTAAFEEDEDRPQTPKGTAKVTTVKASKAPEKGATEETKPEKKGKTRVEGGGSKNTKKSSRATGSGPAETTKPTPKKVDQTPGQANGVKPALQKPDHVPAQVNGVKRKASNSSSPEDSTSTDEESEEAAPSPKKKARSTSPSSSSSDDPESEMPDVGRQAADAHSPPAPTDKITSTTVQAIAAPPFTPPSGFTRMSSTHLEESTHRPLSTSSLEGKQIWHITAPSDIPLSSLTDFSLGALDSDQPILTHDGFDYSISEDKHPADSSTAVMMPTREGYKRLPQSVTRTLQLKQKIPLPNLTARQASQLTGSAAAGSVAQPPVTKVRPHPKGLRMRYRPPGFGDGELGAVGSDSESAGEEDARPAARPVFQFPKALGAHGPEGRDVGGRDADVLDADTQVSSKKEKKKKRKVEVGEPAKVGSPAPKTNGASASSLKQERATQSPGSSPAIRYSEPATNGTPAPAVKGEDGAESKEEKAKRKEEKRLKRERKEAKRKAKEAVV